MTIFTLLIYNVLRELNGTCAYAVSELSFDRLWGNLRCDSRDRERDNVVRNGRNLMYPLVSVYRAIVQL